MEKLKNINKEKLWSKHYILMMITALFIMISMQMSMTTLPVYAQYIGGSKSIAGFTTGIFAISAFLFRPLFGNLLDSKGRKIILVIGIIIFSLTTLSYNFVYTIVIILILRFIHGIGFSAYSNAGGTIIADVVPGSRLSEGVGLFILVNIIAMAFGPTIGLKFTEKSNYNALFILTFILAGIGLVCAFFINYERKEEKFKTLKLKSDCKDGEMDIPTETKGRIIKKNIFFEKTAIPVSLAQFFIALSLGSILTFLPLYALSQNIENIGIFFTVYAIAALCVRIIGGRLADNYGPSWIILPGMLILALSLAILAFAASMNVFLIAAVLFGFGFGAVQPTLNAIMIKLCPINRRGVGNATMFSAIDIGIGLGSILWGFIAEALGFTYIYLGSAVSVFLALIVYSLMVKKQLERSEHKQVEKIV